MARPPHVGTFAIPTDVPPTPPGPPDAVPSDPDTLARQARELAGAARDAEERAEALRRLRDRAIVGLIEAGWSTRRVGRELGMTATQVSTIWRRTRPARGRGNPAPPP